MRKFCAFAAWLAMLLGSLSLAAQVRAADIDVGLPGTFFQFDGICTDCAQLDPVRPRPEGTVTSGILGIRPEVAVGPGTVLTSNDLFYFEIAEPLPDGRNQLVGRLGTGVWQDFFAVVDDTGKAFVDNALTIASALAEEPSFAFRVTTTSDGAWTFESGTYRGQGTGAFWRRVPEPAALLLFGSGAAVVAARRRRMPQLQPKE